MNLRDFDYDFGFFSTWLTAVLTYHPMWAFSLMPSQSEINEVEIQEVMKRSGHSFVYNVDEAQKNDLVRANPSAKFIISSSQAEEFSTLQSLVFVTSYFFRASIVRRKKLAPLTRIKSEQIRSKKVRVRNKTEDDSPTSGVLFLLGENEKLVQSGHQEQEKEESKTFFRKVSLPKSKLFSSEYEENAPLPYGFSVSKHPLPGVYNIHSRTQLFSE